MLKSSFKWVLDNMLPRSAQNIVRRNIRSIVLRHHLRRLQQNTAHYLAANDPHALARIDRIVYGWGNSNWSADSEYLRTCAARAMSVNGQILECGSGISTVVMAAASAQNNVEIIALEHELEWVARVNAVLRQYGFSHAKVLHCPLKEFGGYQWYDLSEVQLSNVALVVCDGPPGVVPGGRYGLLPQAHHSFVEGCTILLDDCQRQEEMDIASRWACEYPLSYEIVGGAKKFADLRYSPTSAQTK